MTNEQKEYIEKHIDLIENKDWKEFFRHAPKGVGQLLYEAEINFLEDVSEILPKMFNYADLTEIVIPNNITNIGGYAFYHCSSLTSVTIPNSVTSIGEAAFRGCTSLTGISIPNSVTSIDDYAFYSCDSLEIITIPNSVTSIGKWAFYWCDSLTEIKYNGTVAELKASRLHIKTTWRTGSSISKIICTDGIINLRPLN